MSDVTAVLVSRTLVMSLSAPTAGYDIVILRDGGGSDFAGVARGRRHWEPNVFTWENLELGIRKEEAEFVDFYGPFCWRGRKGNLESHGKESSEWIVWKSWCCRVTSAG